MYRMLSSTLGLALLATAAAVSATPPPDDDPPPRCATPSTICERTDEYAVVKSLGFLLPKANDCTIRMDPKYDSWTRRCVPLPDPPPEVGLSCTRDPFGVACEASPEGPELSYSWVLSGGLEVPFIDPGSPYLSANCANSSPHASVQVYVIGPGGTYGQAAASFSCEWSDHGQPVGF